MSSTTASFYSEIMPMDGIGGKTFSTASTTLSASTAFFADKRFSTKDQLVDTKSDVMSFENVGTRSRGIRPWEQARFEANQRRQKDAEFFRRSMVIKNNKKKFTNIIPKKLPEIKTAWSEKSSFPTGSEQNVIWMPVKQKPVSCDIRQVIVVDAWDD
jgi:hypothetical protein